MLWQAGHAVRIPPGEVRTLVCRYSDPDERVAQVGAQSLVTPVAGVDFSATRHADGSGSDYTGEIRLRLEAGGSAARLALWSIGQKNKALYVHNLQLRGVPLRSFFPATVVAEDDDSRLTHGLRVLRVDMPLQDDTRVAGDVALALLGHHKDAQPWLTLTVEAAASAGLLAQALTRDVGDRLHVSDAAMALDGAACFIDGLRHEIGASHRVTWHTSPAGLHAYWLIGQSKVGSETRLGY